MLGIGQGNQAVVGFVSVQPRQSLARLFPALLGTAQGLVVLQRQGAGWGLATQQLPVGAGGFV